MIFIKNDFMQTLRVPALLSKQKRFEDFFNHIFLKISIHFSSINLTFYDFHDFRQKIRFSSKSSFKKWPGTRSVCINCEIAFFFFKIFLTISIHFTRINLNFHDFQDFPPKMTFQKRAVRTELYE